MRTEYPAGMKYDPRVHGDPEEFQAAVGRRREQGANIAVDPDTGKVRTVADPHRYAIYGVEEKDLTKRDAPALEPLHGMQQVDDNGKLKTEKVAHAKRVEGQHTYTDEQGREAVRFEGHLQARSTNPRRAADIARAVASAEGRPMAVVDRRTGKVIAVAGAD